ncbi:MAG TPA: hypothetical protein VM823_00360 [Gaiellales bacterium]|nr:hypothetical protein [Gaiellales bacterium]
MTYEAELPDRLELILGTRPPDREPDSDPLLGIRQWLAERNLGLVPVADPAGFDWPGHWIARVRTRGDDHAVIMFGSPSGPLYDPCGAGGERHNRRRLAAGAAGRASADRRAVRRRAQHRLGRSDPDRASG